MCQPATNQSLSANSQMTAEEYASQVKTELGDAWLPNIYRDRIRKLRTRSYTLPAAAPKTPVEIHHTLLGVELKAGRKRLLCPDLATARYLSVFARAGCDQVALPYDITRISQLADELESSWHRMFLLAEHNARETSEPFKSRIRRLLISKIRAEVSATGAGSTIPEFKQTTRQRKT